jgi:CDP-paratose 2-epimerase
MPTCCLRAGCLTGPSHSAVELHGFLSYLVRVNLAGSNYNVYGHQGKQVRDNIHSFDVAGFAERFFAAPRCAEVYNIGGGRANSCSILEAFERVEEVTRRPMKWVYINKPREGDHICYISNLNKLRKHYPGWDVTKTLDDIFMELVNAWKTRGNWPRVGRELAV